MHRDATAMAASKPTAESAMQPRQSQKSNAGFYLVLASLLFEFGRPQALIPGLKLIPFGTGFDVLLLLSVIMPGKLNFSRLQTKLWIPLFVVMAIHIPIARNNYLGSDDFQGYAADLRTLSRHRDVREFSRKDADS